MGSVRFRSILVAVAAAAGLLAAGQSVASAAPAESAAGAWYTVDAPQIADGPADDEW